ncbi:glycosyltransferase [Cognataquiflexum aquatile]|uniref:glycosyltransferase n=1 Tax=Cognataquiflexum aquatile TaxID=2249427 RepID=UPI000DEA685D|nr:glycosyltransferase [Cognataquiflexum aquatile]
MPTLFQICIEVNIGSVGRIAEQIGQVVLDNIWKSFIAYSREVNSSSSELIKIGNKLDVYYHGIETRLLDNHGFSSKKATTELVKKIKQIKPDIIHLHHLHGYYINIEILFEYLAVCKIPVVWTFHDCWSFTGHCTHFDFIGCQKWKTECNHCEQKSEYPKSLLFDRSKHNFADKKRIFNSINGLTIVTVSDWLGNLVKESFLKENYTLVIKNGIDLSTFYPRDSAMKIKLKYNINNRFLIIGVASTWGIRKGFYEFVKLSQILSPENFIIILVGLNSNQMKSIPSTIIGIERTENVEELANLYSAADVFVNPTFEDSYPTTNLEAMACGTPVITYNTGGSVESIDENTGFIVEKHDVEGIKNAIQKISKKGKNHYLNFCRNKASLHFDKNQKFQEYFNLYKRLLLNKNEL